MRQPFEGSVNAYDYIVERDVSVAARDGTRMATDIYLPALNGAAAEGAWPAIVERSPYGKARLSHSVTGRYFARRGYAVAIQDVRGRGSSGGEFAWLQSEGPDGFDAFEWVGRQPWCNGKIASIGLSYTAGAAQALAVERPPLLAAQILFDGAYNYHTYTFRSRGACEYGRILQYVLFMACTSPEATRDGETKRALDGMQADFNGWLIRAPLRRGESPLRLVPAYERWFFDVLTHAGYDDYWKHPARSLEAFIDRYPDVPVLLQTSWYASHISGTIAKFLELSKRHATRKQLLIGTWLHGPDHYGESWAGNVDLGAEAALDGVNDVRLRWLDHHLKGLRTGIDGEKPIRIFVMGGGTGRRNVQGRMNHGGRWRDEPAWPIPATQATPFYLHGDGTLSTSRPQAGAAESTYAYDPANPVPTIGGNNSNLGTPGFLEGGGFDQRGNTKLAFCTDTRPLASRADVLVFRSEPLAQAVEVTGSVVAHLWVSSSAVDTDFTVKLVDEYPPSGDYPEGYALNIADAICRMRYRDSREKAELMEPGTVYPIAIAMQETSNLFASGHRIRIDVSSSNFPHYDANPNTGELLGEHVRTVVAQQTLYHDAARPSHVILPIMAPAG